MKEPAATLWSGRADGRMGFMLLGGLAAWSLYALAAIVFRGVVMDETVVPAQIIAGSVRYPPGHPHAIFYPKAFNLVNYAAAALWTLQPDAFLLSALRNFIFLILSLFVPFAFGLVLTGKPAWGHLAAALTATEAGLRYHGTYPMWVFPNFYSHGHVGLHLALLTVALMLARTWRTAGLLAGLLPGLHAAMPIAVWPWSACYIWLARRGPAGAERRRLYAAFALGLAVCAGFGGWLHLQPAFTQSAPPYDITAGGDVVYRQFSQYIDAHRGIPPLRSPGYLANALAVFLVGGLLLHRIRGNAPAWPLGWLLLFCAWVWAYVFGAAFIRQAFGWFPPILHILMPNRFSNLSAVLLIPVTAAFIGWRLDKPGASRLAGQALLIAALLGSAAALFAQPVRARLHLLAAVWALALAFDLISAGGGRHRKASAAAAVVLGCSLWLSGARYAWAYFGATYLPAAAGLLVLRKALPSDPKKGALPRWARAGIPTSVALLVLLAVLSSGRPAREPRWDAVSEDDRSVARWLAAHAAPGELVLPVIFPRAELQAKTGYPVLAEQETLYLMSYSPELGPSIGALVRDLYDVDLSDPAGMRRIAPRGRLSFYSPVWRDGWKKRSLGQWRLLGRKYGFRLVLSESGMEVNLPAVLKTGTWTLHRIPG
ncbi:MAG: hypothetical protein IT158_03380 [Bryobacterales bacterium]|nr:hypothetical protein [Bryobacterales bacterium]